MNTEEAALIAGLIRGPDYLSPYKNPERALQRRNEVLNAMVAQGKLSEKDAARLTAIPIVTWISAPYAQNGPLIVSVASLSGNPQAFDGRLVSVRASLVFGWEGDNFLFDPTVKSPSKTPTNNEHKPSVWFYCRPGYERRIYSAVPYTADPVQGTFIGYFHFVPNKKGRIKDVFDPGPLQLEAIAVTDLGSQAASY